MTTFQNSNDRPFRFSFLGRFILVSGVAALVFGMSWYLDIGWWPGHSTTLALEQFSESQQIAIHQQTALRGILPAVGTLLVAAAAGYLFLPGYQRRIDRNLDRLTFWLN